MSENDNEAPIAALRRAITEGVAALERSYGLLVDLKVVSRADYSRAGLKALAESAVRAQANSQFAAAELASCQRRYGALLGAVRKIADGYQLKYDQTVARSVDGPRMADRSWEERASIFRTMMVDDEINKRWAERQQAVAQELLRAIDTLARAHFRVRYDVSAVADILKMGESINELS